MPEQTIDQKKTLWTNKLALTFAVTLILGTNTGSIFVQQQGHNTEQIAYNVEASKRRLDNSMKIHTLEQRIIFLEDKLEECNGRKK